ncbi:MAG TPA: metal-dependent hydrolase [Polyangia bacterium]|jgi:inner membrane protein|nr:metal-dependent hydrolase [Polyangia bacterium]
MASFGHVAMGLLTGRLHGGTGARPARRDAWKPLVLFAALAVLPDADVLLVALGVKDGGTFGHRGALHSLSMALLVGLLCALWARRAGWPVWRTALAGCAAVASHTLLDLLGAGGRSLELFWPLSSARYHSPWRFLPDSPRGMKLLSRHGLVELATEFALFLPMTMYSLWPHLRARLGRTPLPSLRLVDAASAPAAHRKDSPNSVAHDPPWQSSG